MKTHFAMFLSWFLLCFAAAPGVAVDAAPSAPAAQLSAEATQLKGKLSELFEKSKNVNAKGAKGTDARAAIDGALDWDRIAKDCLPDSEFKKAGSKNISDFKGLLKDVIVKTAYSRLDSFWKGAEYSFPEIKVTGEKAHAKAIFKVKDKEGADEEFALDYYLFKRPSDKKWMIYDVAFDEVRYSENIREQIKTFLGEKGFPNLLTKLRERRKELVESQTNS
jgi:ABC-type transporter MlaC component